MTEDEYNAAVQRIGELMDARPDTPEGAELDRLVTTVKTYEAGHCPIDPPSPEVMEEFRREQEGKTDG